jgi:cell division septum initiation protein DivIVA
VTVNRLVAYNMAFFRKAAGLGQQEFGEPLGWSVASVSAAERSWDGKRVKKFDADEIVLIAAVLGVPLAALFLPPEDHETAVRYVLQFAGKKVMSLDDLLPLALPSAEGDSPAMDAYRKRVIAAGASGRQVDNLDVAARVLVLAQRTADEAIDAARGEADQTLGRARSETEVILAKALRQAEQITGDARARAESLERDAQERHRQAMGSLVHTREELERRVDELRAFEREYRTKLSAFMEGQLKDLWTGEMHPQAERAIEELRKAAAESEGQRTSAVLLREDGTYDVLQFGRAGEGGARPQKGAQAYREGPTYSAPDVTEGGGSP